MSLVPPPTRRSSPEDRILIVQSNLANIYLALRRLEQALCLKRDVYSGWLKLEGEEHELTLVAANNYAIAQRAVLRAAEGRAAQSEMQGGSFEETKALLRKTIPVARRVLGEENEVPLKMRGLYAQLFYEDTTATLDDLREAVNTFEDLKRTARRVFGGAHPITEGVGRELLDARAALGARENAAGGRT